MPVEHIIAALVIMLGLSLIAQPVSQWLSMPYASVLVVFGYIASELIVFAGIDTGLRAENFQSIVFYVFIPVLVFESAYNMDKQALRKNIVVILFLAILAMLLTCTISAVFLFYGIAHETGFPWIAAFLTGAILAATDPVAIISKLKEQRDSRRVALLLEGESLFNDATSIVLFGLFLSMATMSGFLSPFNGTEVSYDGVVLDFFTVFFGGALIGLIIGLSFGLLQKNVSQRILAGVMSLVVAYGSYLVAEYFKVSGVMSTLMAALSYSALAREQSQANETGNAYLWHIMAHVANACVFLVMGAVVTLEMFEHRWLAMLIAIAAVLIARAISVYGLLAFFALFENLKVSLSGQTVMVWGGLRGAVTLALALSLPTSLDYWWTIQSIAFGVVIFSLFVQAPLLNILADKLSGKAEN